MAKNKNNRNNANNNAVLEMTPDMLATMPETTVAAPEGWDRVEGTQEGVITPVATEATEATEVVVPEAAPWTGVDPFAVVIPTPVVAEAPKAKKAKMGVNPDAKSRSYYAGLIIAKHGFATGVTTAMVAELNEAYGTRNDVESDSRLRYAYHAIRAYLEATKAGE